MEYVIEEFVDLEQRQAVIVSTIGGSKWEYDYSILKIFNFFSEFVLPLSG